YRPAPYRMFRDTPVDQTTHNVIRLMIDPEQGITIGFDAKVPGPEMRLGPVDTALRYQDFFPESPNVGYETLLYDCMTGDATLFQRADAIEAGWGAMQPVLEAWARGEGDVQPYPAGSKGPEAAAALLARDGRYWQPLETPKPRARP
ncbi:MAG: glucose-6-phosphate dehydrogenase, partial [Acetobacteraceae bacterium]